VSIVGPALDSYAQNLYHLSRRESCESSRQTNKTGFSILKESAKEGSQGMIST